jgi:hypothetical protein
MPRPTVEIIKQLPNTCTLRARIAALDREATYLRRLLRLVLLCPPSAGPLPVGDDCAKEKEVQRAT